MINFYQEPSSQKNLLIIKVFFSQQTTINILYTSVRGSTISRKKTYGFWTTFFPVRRFQVQHSTLWHKDIMQSQILLTFHVLLALAASVSQGNAEVVYHIGLSSGRRLEPPCGNFSAPCADFYTALRAHKINANETGLQQVRFKYAAGTYFPAGNRSSVVVDTRVSAPLIIEGV